MRYLLAISITMLSSSFAGELAQTRLKFEGVMQGGEVTVGRVGFEKSVKVNTVAAESIETLATKLAIANTALGVDRPFNGVTFESASSTIAFESTAGKDLYLKTSDPGLQVIPRVTNISATPVRADGKITLSWSASALPDLRISIFRGGVLIGVVRNGITSFEDTTLAQSGPEVTYNIISHSVSGGLDTSILQASDVASIDVDNPLFLQSDDFIFVTGTADPAVVQKSYSFKFVTAGGRAPLVWRITEGSLPSGLTLDNKGTLSGVCTAVGTYSFRIVVEDMSTRKVNKQFTLRVLPYPPLPK